MGGAWFLPSTARIPNKHPLNKVYMGLIIKGARIQTIPPFAPMKEKAPLFHCCTGWKVFDHLVCENFGNKNLSGKCVHRTSGDGTMLCVYLLGCCLTCHLKHTGSTSVCLKLSCPKNKDDVTTFPNSMKSLYLDSPNFSGKQKQVKHLYFWWFVHGGKKLEGLQFETKDLRTHP